MVMEFAYNDILENVQVNNIILAAAGEGVISGLDVSERGAGVNMSVDVATGSALIGGTTYTESSIVNLAISAADATHARKDLVIYDVATTNPLVVTGTPATPPTPPDITTGDILLAIVNVAANETEITNSEITDGIVEVVTGGSLDGLSNVVITTIADNELLAWDTSSSKWINQTPSEAALAGLAGFTMAGSINMGNYQINGVDDIKAFDSDGITLKSSVGTTLMRLGYNSYNKLYHKLDMTSHIIENLTDPTAAQDAATKAWVDAHNWAATDITSGILAVARGGTGVADDSYDADKVDGCDAGTGSGDVLKIPGVASGYLLAGVGASFTSLTPGTSSYQLTSQGAGSILTWAAASDLIFSDTHCPKCGQEFKDGDNLILHVIGHNEVGDILTLPMHKDCANQPKKIVAITRKMFEDRYVLDEDTGELKIQRVVKMQEKLVTKHKLKEGYVLNDVTGKAHKLNKEGKSSKTQYDLSTALKTAEETVSEIVYESIEYEL